MKRILPYLKPYRGKMLLGMLLIAVSSVCSLLLPTIMSDILDGGIYTSDWDYILRCCGRMLLVTLLSLGAVAAGTWCRTQVVSGFCADLRAAVFGRVNALTFEEVSRIGTSALLTRSTHDVGTLAWVADMLSSNIITIPVLFFGGVVLAFSKDSTLALIILVAMPIITLLVLAIGRRVEPLWKISDQFCDKQNDLVRERLHGIRVIRAFNREEQEQGRIAEATRVMAEHIIEANTKMGLVAPIAIALMNLVAVAILYFGGSRMQSGISAASGGDIFAMVQYVALVMNGIVMAAFALVMYPHAKVAAGRIGEVMDASMMTETAEEDDNITFAGDIRMENVTFRYEGADAAAVSDVSLHIAAGQKVAIIGGTGSGKSTLVQLLNPFAPHMTEELWEKLGHSHDEQLAYYPWPAYEEAKCVEAAVEIAVQVNGKVKARLKVPADITAEDAIATAKADPAVAAALEGKQLVKEIYVKGRLVNLAAKG